MTLAHHLDDQAAQLADELAAEDAAITAEIARQDQERHVRGMRRRTQVGTIVHHTVARETGATVTVERTGPGSWIEQDPGWMTICLNHGACCMHDTRALARAHAAAPSGWCGDCDHLRLHRERITTGRIR